MTKPMRTLDRTLLAGALVLLAAVGYSALHDASQAWDVWYYHLPFAARLLGIVNANEYVFSRANESRFAGFPLGGEIIQGLLWRITGRPESANLLAFASVPLFALFLRRKFGVGWHHAVLALFAVPLVMTHASAAYVDLPANVCAAALVLIVARASTQTPTRTTLLGAAALAAGAAHMRFQLAPIVFLSLAALAWFARGRDRLVVATTVPFVFAWPLKNLLVHGNPAYPVSLAIGPLRFAGPESPYASSPTWLAKYPGPARFFASVLELGARPFDDARRWTVDQWTPPDHDGYRMGGFFGAYVVVLVIVTSFFVRRSRRDANEGNVIVRALALALVALTVVVALSPQSHELRYYLVWMLVLVSTALAAVPIAMRTLFAAACAGFVVMVIGVTRGDYVRPLGESFRDLVVHRVSAEALASPKDGERVCVANAPWTFLHAAPFHPPHRYVVVEAEDDGVCAP